MEPLLVGATHHIPPVNIPRYQMFPLGDGARMTLADMIQSHQNIFSGQSSSRLTPIRTRRMSSESIQSGLFDTQQAHIIADVKKKWWGTKRLGELSSFGIGKMSTKIGHDPVSSGLNISKKLHCNLLIGVLFAP